MTLGQMAAITLLITALAATGGLLSKRHRKRIEKLYVSKETTQVLDVMKRAEKYCWLSRFILVFVVIIVLASAFFVIPSDDSQYPTAYLSLVVVLALSWSNFSQYWRTEKSVAQSLLMERSQASPNELLSDKAR